MFLGVDLMLVCGAVIVAVILVILWFRVGVVLV